MANSVYDKILEGKTRNTGQLAILVDPDKSGFTEILKIAEYCKEAHVDYLLVGGSFHSAAQKDFSLDTLKTRAGCPVVIFPGPGFMIQPDADALLFLSLISGRNPELLIGRHVEAAPGLKRSELEVIPTGYVLIEGGSPTAVSYISQTAAIPNNQLNIIVATASAGELLGMKMIYLEAGSGAATPVSSETIGAVSQAVNIPLIVGGGITSPEKASLATTAGADIVVVGNAVESSPELIFDLSAAVHSSKILSH